MIICHLYDYMATDWLSENWLLLLVLLVVCCNCCAMARWLCSWLLHFWHGGGGTGGGSSSNTTTAPRPPIAAAAASGPQPPGPQQQVTADSDSLDKILKKLADLEKIVKDNCKKSSESECAHHRDREAHHRSDGSRRSRGIRKSHHYGILICWKAISPLNAIYMII